MLRIIFAIFCVGLVVADRVKFTPLPSMPANAAINWVEIIGCNINKCEVKRGESVRLQSEFVSGGNYTGLFGKVSTVFFGVPFTLPLEESNACKLNVKCPVQQGDVNILIESTNVSPSYPAVTVNVQFELFDTSSGKLAVGFTTPISIV